MPVTPADWFLLTRRHHRLVDATGWYFHLAKRGHHKGARQRKIVFTQLAYHAIICGSRRLPFSPRGAPPFATRARPLNITVLMHIAGDLNFL